MQFYLAGVIGSLLLRTACTEQAPPPVMSPASVVTRSDIQKVAYMTLDAATIVAAAIFLIFQDRGNLPRDFEKAVDAAIGHLTRYPKSVQDEALGAAELSPKERPPLE